ncbi:MAG: ATP-binding protein [Flavobacterium sp.]|nr:ATP-binding protein [Flavobacterium sp.]
MIDRILEKTLKSKLHTGKAIVLLGARQVGKTTLLKTLFSSSEDLLWLNGDELDVQALFASISATRLKAIFGTKKIIIIDEAQRIHEIGLRMKLITDQIPEVQLVVTGSSSFELANKLNEPLTGRKWEYQMYPISFGEMVAHHGLLEEKRLLAHRMVYGYYPDVINNAGIENEILKQLSNSYLYKDVLLLEQIKKPQQLIKLLQGLAYQVGSQVSYNELSQLTGLDAKTVEKYIEVLEKTFIIFRLGSFSRNLRSELKKSRKIYFYDNGIRNALIANFNQVELRTDVGALWENFIVSERIKYSQYSQNWRNSWYWRTKEQKEIDYIEEQNGVLTAFEFKWNPDAKHKIPKLFLATYPGSQFKIIHRDNLENFLI